MSQPVVVVVLWEYSNPVESHFVPNKYTIVLSHSALL